MYELYHNELENRRVLQYNKGRTKSKEEIMCKCPQIIPRTKNGNEPTVSFGEKISDDVIDSKNQNFFSDTLERVGEEFTKNYFAQEAEKGNIPAIIFFRSKHGVGPSGRFT